MSADSAVETAASGKATSDCREEKDIPRPKQKRPVDPAVVAALAGKFTPNPHKSTSFPKPTHEVSMPRGRRRHHERHSRSQSSAKPTESRRPNTTR